MSNSPDADVRSRSPDPATLSLGNVELDLSTFRVSVGSRPVELSYQEFEVLRLLACSSDRVMTFGEISNDVWGTQGRRENRRLNVVVCRLRSKLADSAPYRLETVRGRGYGLLNRGSESDPGQRRKGGAA